MVAIRPPSIPAIRSTCDRVNPLSRWRPNSRRRRAVAITKVFTTEITVYAAIMPASR